MVFGILIFRLFLFRLSILSDVRHCLLVILEPILESLAILSSLAHLILISQLATLILLVEFYYLAYYCSDPPNPPSLNLTAVSMHHTKTKQD